MFERERKGNKKDAEKSYLCFQVIKWGPRHHNHVGSRGGGIVNNKIVYGKKLLPARAPVTS